MLAKHVAPISIKVKKEGMGEGRGEGGEREREEGREEEWIFIVKAFPKSTVGFPGGASGKESTC